MIEEIRKILEDNNIQLNVGMTENEITKAEEFYGIEFPKDMKEMLMNFVPISNGFYNWNDYSDENISRIKDMIEWPYEGIIYDIENNEFWLEEFGKCPKNIEDRIQMFKKYIAENEVQIPKLIPINSHRYVISGKVADYPIISVYQTDIIYYGSNLLEYFENEFNHTYNITNIANIKRIPFWNQIIDL